MKKTIITLFLLISFLNTISCGLYRPTDAKEFPPQPELRIKEAYKLGFNEITLPSKQKVMIKEDLSYSNITLLNDLVRLIMDSD